MLKRIYTKSRRYTIDFPIQSLDRSITKKKSEIHEETVHCVAICTDQMNNDGDEWAHDPAQFLYAEQLDSRETIGIESGDMKTIKKKI